MFELSVVRKTLVVAADFCTLQNICEHGKVHAKTKVNNIFSPGLEGMSK